MIQLELRALDNVARARGKRSGNVTNVLPFAFVWRGEYSDRRVYEWNDGH